jgi:hypothetical protein
VEAEEEEDVNFQNYPLTREAVRQNAIEANRLGVLRWARQLPEPEMEAEEEEEVTLQNYPRLMEAVRQRAIEANRLGGLRRACAVRQAQSEPVETITISTSTSSSGQSVVEVSVEPEVPVEPAQPETIRISTSSSGESVMMVPPTTPATVSQRRPVATVRPMPRQVQEQEMENPNNQPNGNDTWGTWGSLHSPEEVERANFSVPFLPDISYGSFASDESAADRFNNRSFND